MKKLLKATLITLIAVFALLGASVTVLGATNYINWNGSTAYQNILITLEQITTRGQELKTERDNSNRSNEQLVNQIKDKDNLINAKTQENEALKKENDKIKITPLNFQPMSCSEIQGHFMAAIKSSYSFRADIAEHSNA